MRQHMRGEPLPATQWNRIGVPTLSVAGGKSPPWMRNAMQAIAGVVRSARYRTLEGQNHMVKAKVLAPVLVDFFR
ncbi:hypothetical protein D3C83_163280 [compost metagenome]